MHGNPRQTGHQVERGRWALQFPELDEVLWGVKFYVELPSHLFSDQ